MAAQRLDQPGSKLACAERWLPEVTWLPEAVGLKVDQLYRALDFLMVWSEEIERDVFLRAADLFRLDVDLIFYDTTTAYFEIDEADERDELWAGRLFAPLRRRGHSKEGRDNQPQVIIALAVTRDGMPVRSWVLPGNTADVTTVARIKEDLRAWRLGRCVFVGDAGMYSADNLKALSLGLGRYILAVPMRKVKDVETEVLTRPGRYRQIADNLQVKEVWVGEGERRRRYVLCLNPEEAERQRCHREAVLAEIEAELALLERRDDDHPKAACDLMASRRHGRYLSTDGRGRPQARCRQGQGCGGVRRQVRGHQQRRQPVGRGSGARIQRRPGSSSSCFRRMKQTGLQVRPMFHWSARRIVAHVKLCVLALQIQRAAEIRCALPWARIADQLDALKVVRYQLDSRTIVQRTKIIEELAVTLKKLGVSTPKQVLTVAEPAPALAAP